MRYIIILGYENILRAFNEDKGIINQIQNLKADSEIEIEIEKIGSKYYLSYSIDHVYISIWANGFELYENIKELPTTTEGH